MSFSPPEISSSKAHLRLEMKTRRAVLGESARAQASRQVCAILNDWLCSHAERTIAVYLARPFEIDLDSLARELLRAGKVVCAPRVDIVAGTMKFYRLPNLNAVTRGAFGVREPISEEAVRPEIAFVPGLAFDRRGCRLGTGGGWYDRVLSEIPVKMGVVFREQIVGEVPTESHDITMDWLASDAGLLRCGE